MMNNYLYVENFITNTCFITLFLTVFFYWLQTIFDLQNSRFNLGGIMMIVSNVLLLLCLLVRWKSSQHFPLSNLCTI